MTDPPDPHPVEPSSPALDRVLELIALGPRETEPRGTRGRIVAEVRRRLALALRPQFAHQREVDAALADAIAQLRDRVRAAELLAVEHDRHGRELAERTVELAERTVELTGQTVELRQVISDVGGTLRAQVRAALHTKPYLAGTAFSQFDSPVGSVIGFTAFTPHAASEPSEVYRGSAELARDLVAPYVTLLAGHSPVVDLACGAGELLSELAAAGIQAHGVESDPELAARCRDHDLTAHAGDPLSFLEAQPNHSLGAVFSSGVVERLPVAAQWRLLEFALSALRPGGLLIAETLNPHSISAMRMLAVAELDQHPVFPEVALGMCGLSGFGRAFVFAPGHPNFETARFTAARYAVVATASGPPADGGDGV